ncbi:MAG TPA: hypothetical protein DCR87_05610 [Acidobacteria bacterium]|nr:hypothetical protein [Acidobacteriota bacterium]
MLRPITKLELLYPKNRETLHFFDFFHTAFEAHLKYGGNFIMPDRILHCLLAPQPSKEDRPLFYFVTLSRIRDQLGTTEDKLCLFIYAISFGILALLF